MYACVLRKAAHFRANFYNGKYRSAWINNAWQRDAHQSSLLVKARHPSLQLRKIFDGGPALYSLLLFAKIGREHLGFSVNNL
jgi:hypothetical protein